ncbi:MAG: class I tRNA ligase family protein, partial [Candidatus Bathyarchaeia archaeon]
MSARIVGKVPKEYLPQKYEEEIMDFWEFKRVYEKTRSRAIGKPKFYFLDGPPYVTNPPHVGTAWNKTLKDVVIRFKRMQGYDVRDQPGYDCHGLPIEVKVEEELGVKSKKDIEEKIDKLVSQVSDLKNCIFNIHVPPYGTPLDLAPKLDE